jgi:hypothetical protein
VLDDVPPGMGGEDFGGSICLAENGKLYLQAGKTAFWNVEVVGLDKVHIIEGGKIRVTEADASRALKIREKYLQEAAGKKELTIVKATPIFTGNIVKDFPEADPIEYGKEKGVKVRSAAAWDEKHLYIAWDVDDPTPWRNAATDPAQMYTHGDTVDLQLGPCSGSAASSGPDRSAAADGDLRLSIGNFGGKPTAVMYREVAGENEKKPRTFSSGVVKEFRVDYAAEVSGVVVKVTLRSRGYVVEAAIPRSLLGSKLERSLLLCGDLGVTHGGTDGERTRLRTYWSNRATGIVDDAVFELKLEPRNWGTLRLRE